MNRWFVAALALLTGIGLGLRLPELGLRPMHNDEAVNAMKFRLLWMPDNHKNNVEDVNRLQRRPPLCRHPQPFLSLKTCH
jgi:hypothetical protein